MEHQEYMDVVYDFWEKNPNLTRLQACDKFDTVYKVAVQMGNFNYQVCNGGVPQWAFNGYMKEDINDLIEWFSKATKIVPESKKILDLLTQILKEADGNAAIALSNESDTETEICMECNGTGAYTDICVSCDGAGKIEEEDCPDCDGLGEVYETCESCAGTGEYEETISKFETFCDSMSTIDEQYYSIVNAEAIMQEILDKFDEVLYADADIIKKDNTPTKKPKCTLVGKDGNIFNLLGIAGEALRKAKQADKIKEMTKKVKATTNYSEALAVIMEYVDVS
jgi:hypothetical protein